MNTHLIYKMGVHQFNQSFGDAGKLVKNIETEINGAVIGYDISIPICASIKAMYHGTHLTDPTGIPTAGTNTLLSNILRFQKANATVIGICDNPKPNPYKSAEYKKRRNARNKAEQKAKNTSDHDEKKKYEAAAWSLDAAVIADAQMLMKHMGVEFHIAPQGREAEQYAADLAKDGELDIVISNDTDAVMFGAPIVILNNTDKKTKTQFPYVVYKIDEILTMYNIELRTFQKMCVALGTDFAPKTKGVGPKTVFTSGKNKQLDMEQEVALSYIRSELPLVDVEVSKTSLNKNALINWLVESKGFNRDRIVKKLKVL
jgi:5'-3' exonuclease